VLTDVPILVDFRTLASTMIQALRKFAFALMHAVKFTMLNLLLSVTMSNCGWSRSKIAAWLTALGKGVLRLPDIHIIKLTNFTVHFPRSAKRQSAHISPPLAAVHCFQDRDVAPFKRHQRHCEWGVRRGNTFCNMVVRYTTGLFESSGIILAKQSHLERRVRAPTRRN